MAALFYDTSKFSDLDLLFFHTESKPYAVIQSACFCDWCHVAILVEFTDEEIATIRDRYYDVHSDKRKARRSSTVKTISSERTRKYVLESTSDNLTCAVTGEFSDGVKLTLLKDDLKRCNAVSGNYYAIKKVIVLNENDKERIKRRLVNDVLPELLNTPYEKDYGKLVKTWIRWIGFKNCCDVRESSEDSIFCSELIVHLFTEVGLLNAYHEDTSHLTRARTATTDKANYEMPLQRWSGLGFCGACFWHCQCSSCRCCGCDNGSEDPLGDTYYTDEDMTVEDFLHIERRFPPGAGITYEKTAITYRP